MSPVRDNHPRRLSIAAALVASTALLGLTPTTVASAAAEPTLQAWGATQTLTTDVRIDEGPTVVVTPAGTSVALWIERGHGSYAVMSSQLRVGRSHWTTPRIVSKGGFYATITTHAADRVTVAWQHFVKGGAGISARTLRPDGTWGQVQQVARWKQSGGVTVSLVISANARGEMAAAYTRRGHIQVAYRPAGQNWRPSTRLPEPGAYAQSAMVNVSGEGRVDVVFPASATQGKSDLFAYHRSLSGDWTGQVVARFASGVHFRGTTFAADANRQGDVSVAWMERAARDEPWAVNHRFQPAGEAFTQPELVATRARTPQVGVDADGTTTLAWEARNAGTTDVDLARRSSAGVWSTTQVLASRTSDRFYRSQVGLDVNARGDAVVQFIGQHDDGSGGMRDDHRVIRCPAASDCGAGFQLVGPRYYRAASLAIASDGGATAAWTSGCATEECIPTRVHARVMTPVD